GLAARGERGDEGGDVARGEGVAEVADEGAGAVGGGERVAVFGGLLDRLQGLVEVVHVLVRPTLRRATYPPGEHRAHAGDGEQGAERAVAPVGDARRVDVDQPREGAGVGERGAHAQVAAHRVADDAAAAHAERVDELNEKRRQSRSAVARAGR